MVQLGDVCEVAIGKTPPRADDLCWDTQKKTKNIWVSIADMKYASGKIIVDSKEYLSSKGIKMCKPVLKGTLLVSFKLTLGRLAYAGCNLYTNEAIAALTVKNKVTQNMRKNKNNNLKKNVTREALINEFLYYYLLFFDWSGAADVKIKGKTLNKDKLKKIPIFLPPLEVQKQIVQQIEEFNKKMLTLTDGQAFLKEKLKKMRAAILQQALRGQLL